MDMETLGYFIFMDEQERKEKEQPEDDDGESQLVFITRLASLLSKF